MKNNEWNVKYLDNPNPVHFVMTVPGRKIDIYDINQNGFKPEWDVSVKNY